MLGMTDVDELQSYYFDVDNQRVDQTEWIDRLICFIVSRFCKKTDCFIVRLNNCLHRRFAKKNVLQILNWCILLITLARNMMKQGLKYFCLKLKGKRKHDICYICT